MLHRLVRAQRFFWRRPRAIGNSALPACAPIPGLMLATSASADTFSHVSLSVRVALVMEPWASVDSVACDLGFARPIAKNVGLWKLLFR